ncbi:MAG TPA: DUF6714 family protein [Gemmataceae bacterium]|nr:DUF6714 family protein [Gemmataceae bacterium]
MLDKEAIKAQIREAFADVEYPGDWCLSDSNEGDEPIRVKESFRGKTDWRLLDADFIDRAPGGLSSALSFFSDEAFRFYLPAYLMADLDGNLVFADPVFHLCQGLDSLSRNNRIGQRRYGERTWFDYARYRFSTFTNQEASAIVAYLQWMSHLERYPDEPGRIEQALQNYWLARTKERTT